MKCSSCIAGVLEVFVINKCMSIIQLTLQVFSRAFLIDASTNVRNLNMFDDGLTFFVFFCQIRLFDSTASFLRAA